MLICGVFCFVINEIMLNSVQMPLYPFYFILYPLSAPAGAEHANFNISNFPFLFFINMP